MFTRGRAVGTQGRQMRPGRKLRGRSPVRERSLGPTATSASKRPGALLYARQGKPGRAEGAPGEKGWSAMTFYKFAVGVVLAVAMVAVLGMSAVVFSARDFQFGVARISPS